MDKYLMYLRKSRQDNPLETVEEVLGRHEKILQDFALQVLGYSLPEDCIYREVVSGETIEKRPKMRKLLKEIEDPDVKGVFAVDAQRLSRGDLTDCGTVIKAFKYTNTRVFTPVKTYDLWDKFDEKMFRDELLRGREYLDYAREVMTRGRKLSQAEGWFTSGSIPFGYDREWVKVGIKERPTLKPNPEEADAVRLVFESFVYLRMSTVQIADRLNNLGFKPKRAEHFNSTAITAILRNELYAGLISVNKRPKKETLVNGQIVVSRPRATEYKSFPGRHPALISQELFDMAQERLGTLPHIKKHTELKNPFAGILHCSCGRCMMYTSQHGRPRMVCNNSKFCKTRSLPYDLACEELTAHLKKCAEDFEIKVSQGADAGAEKHKIEVEKLQAALDDCTVQQDRLYTFLENGTYTIEVFKERNALLAKRREELQTKYSELIEQAPPDISYEEMAGTLYEAIDALNSPTLTPKQKNDFLKEIVEKIVYTPTIIEDGSQWGKLEFDLDIFLKTAYIS